VPPQERTPEAAEQAQAAQAPKDAAAAPSALPDAAERATEAPSEPAQAPNALEEIRRELTTIRHSLLYEKSSVWNVLGAVCQCFAVAAVLAAVARWERDPHTLLTLGVFLQLMTLTFYFHGR